MPVVVACDEPHRALAVPERQRIRLVLALAVRELDLQHDGSGGHGKRRVRVWERRLKLERPLLPAFLDESRQTLEPGAPLG